MIIVSLMIAVWTSYITMEDIEAAFFHFFPSSYQAKRNLVKNVRQQRIARKKAYLNRRCLTSIAQSI